MGYKIDEIKYKLQELLTKKRYEHSLGVADEAVKLANLYGADSDKAFITGLVHDCCKDMSYEKMLELAKKYKLDFDNISLSNKKLLHASLGARYANEFFKIDDSEVIDAITYHTTGRANMTLLEKIIYIADYIEPTRKDYYWLCKMRELAYEDLDKAVLYGLDLSIEYLLQDKMLIHKNTVEARNDMLMKKEE